MMKKMMMDARLIVFLNSHSRRVVAPAPYANV